MLPGPGLAVGDCIFFLYLFFVHVNINQWPDWTVGCRGNRRVLGIGQDTEKVTGGRFIKEHPRQQTSLWVEDVTLWTKAESVTPPSHIPRPPPTAVPGVITRAPCVPGNPSSVGPTLKASTVLGPRTPLTCFFMTAPNRLLLGVLVIFG